MTQPSNASAETQEQLRTRVAELELQLAEARQSYSLEARIGTTALVALGGALVLTTPLALVTLKRWVDWWRN
jgi:hypothetical protein